jgi:hypothetical protein
MSYEEFLSWFKNELMSKDPLLYKRTFGE